MFLRCGCGDVSLFGKGRSKNEVYLLTGGDTGLRGASLMETFIRRTEVSKEYYGLQVGYVRIYVWAKYYYLRKYTYPRTDNTILTKSWLTLLRMQ